MLEENFILPYLHSEMDFADFGCGGGESTVKYASKVKSCLALEQSNRLRGLAVKRADEAGLRNIEVVEGKMFSHLSRFENKFHCVLRLSELS